MNKITAEEAKKVLKNIKDDIVDYRDIINGNVVSGSSITTNEELDKLFYFIEQQLQANEPLTGEEWKSLEKNQISIAFTNRRKYWLAELYSNKTRLCLNIFGIGHTKAESEHDAYEQAKEQGLLK